jgi:hypothetical protein
VFNLQLIEGETVASHASSLECMKELGFHIIPFYTCTASIDDVIAEVERIGTVRGTLPFDIDGARLLYQVTASSYERRSIILTTNIEFSKWGTVFADDKLAAAIIDRIVHHERLIEFTGPSHRIGEALMFGKNQPQ